MNTLLYIVVLNAALYGSWLFTKLSPEGGRVQWKTPWLTIAFSIFVSVCGIVQVVNPQFIDNLWRDPAYVFQGEWWRLFTSLIAQDGGDTGTIFNVVTLLLIGCFAEQFLSRRNWLITFFVGALVTNLVALYWAPVGGGTSIGIFALAGALLTKCLMQKKFRNVRVAGLVGGAAALVLLALQDIHGVSAVVGMALALFLLK